MRKTWFGLAVTFPALLAPAAAEAQERERKPQTPVPAREVLPGGASRVPVHPEGTQARIVIGFAGGRPGAPPPSLFLVDGVEMTRNPADLPLDPEEIETVEILKGAAAVARFGERARDGVALIRTKRAAAAEREAATEP